MTGNLPATRHETAMLPGELGRLVTNRRGLPGLNPHEAVAYRLWCKEAKAAALERDRARAAQLRAAGRVQGAMILTENGWELPSGPLNPRVIDQASHALTPYEAATEAAIQAQVNAAAADHEHAVLAGDMWDFQRMYREWELPIRFYFEPLNG
jgi:hypothetical protein